ncbi:hypothetical protein DPMN_098852 [Dreissena polymorpha]|uniref:Uncharacterized protein n=1 Tax=Dreissena polymorpha TaxID=45954 RepID=A0A9D4LCW7_DREPO|nr:hypothetical protein DPMN_098852 [Dreissena polymorpha]
MSEVLNDIGVGKHTVKRRRSTFLWREKLFAIEERFLGYNTLCFHFGSQSEGTTTPGLQSDIDLLISFIDVNIMTDWVDWKAGMSNFLMTKHVINPPQHYL